MLQALLLRYIDYQLFYYPSKKMLYIGKPILVQDYVNIRNIIRDFNIPIKEIKIGSDLGDY